MVLFVTPAPGWGWADDYFWLCVGAYSSDWSSANCRNIRSLDTHPRPLHLAQSLNDSANGALTHQTQFESFVGFCLSRPLLQPFGIKRLAAFPQRQSSGRQLSRYSQARQTRHHPNSASFCASTRSLLLPLCSSLLCRGSQTTTSLTNGRTTSCSHCACVPSSNVTDTLPRSCLRKPRTRSAPVSIIDSITTFPAPFNTTITMLARCTSIPT